MRKQISVSLGRAVSDGGGGGREGGRVVAEGQIS